MIAAQSESVFNDNSAIFNVISSVSPIRTVLFNEQASKIGYRVKQRFNWGYHNIAIAVTGSPGTKNEALAGKIAGEVHGIAGESGFRTVDHRVNCYNNRTFLSIVKSILREEHGIEARGKGEREILNQLTGQLTSDIGYLVLVVTNIHILSSRCIHSFLNLKEKLENRIALIMTSYPGRWKALAGNLENLKEDLLVVKAPPPCREEIEIITGGMDGKMFKKGRVERKALEEVMVTCEKYQSIRYGLELLWRAGTQADRDSCEKVTVDHVRMFKEY